MTCKRLNGSDLDRVTSHFSTMLEPITLASFLSSLSIIHGRLYPSFSKIRLINYCNYWGQIRLAQIITGWYYLCMFQK